MPSDKGQSSYCPRCGEPLRAEPHTAEDAAGRIDSADEHSSFASANVVSSTCGYSSTAYDGWEQDEQLRHIERVLQAARSFGQRSDNAASDQTPRCDATHGSHVGLSGWHMPQSNQRRAPNPVAASDTSGAFASSVLWLGTTSLVCGGVLLGWSLAAGRQELWNIGLPVALIGQVAMLIGVVLRLERLWRESRTAVASLHTVNEQLHELKTTTTLLGANHGPTAGVFYTHLAGGAGPQLLLSDLKSQLDLLAVKLSQEER